jgi:hypothetical protein
MRARKRHRGGGGLAVPGPFKRIARAGGQKVTIRRERGDFFKLGSGLSKFFSRRNDGKKVLSAAENRQIDAVAAELAVERRAQLLGQAADDPLELTLLGLSARSSGTGTGLRGCQPGGQVAGPAQRHVDRLVGR